MEWEVVGVANNSQRGTSERVREKMIKISEKTKVTIDNGAIGENSQAIERALQERVDVAEERARAAEGRSHELQLRAHNAEQRTIGTDRRAHNAEQRVHEAEQRVHNLQQRLHISEQRITEVERQLHVAQQRAREFERRERQPEAPVQQSQQESHWLIQPREIELTEEEKGRGGWAAVKVANFRGTRVAAKCFYQQIMVSRYNRQLFNREMNMAARLRHPNLVQFIGASLEGEPIVLTELMTTSLRAELEKGPIEHAQITSISLDVARALNYLHLMQPHPIIHRDISSANVLLDPLPGNGWKAKVSDYGSVNLLRELRTVGPGSPVYAAPEASVPAEQSPKMDIFSFGVLLIEMLSDEFPAEDARQRLLDSINHAGYLDLIRRCLREQKEERPSANEIIANIRDM